MQEYTDGLKKALGQEDRTRLDELSTRSGISNAQSPACLLLTFASIRLAHAFASCQTGVASYMLTKCQSQALYGRRA